ncbi:metallophosphoesterase family protein [Sulfitobacter sp. HNIBRBA3233]|uniref:metallophosphoesterase family protein n=1 Tax=Sulfitobacter marinivivus TaxID=3158558 RepID=UPI0032DEBA11
MKHSDLGRLEGDLLIFGGPYSNLQALTALLAQAKEMDIPPERMICTGDIVAYCGAPAETVAAVRQHGCTVVAGNCERQLAAGEDDCGCGFEEGSACDRLSQSWYAFARDRVPSADRLWMAGLPDVVSFQSGQKRYAVIHGGVPDVAQFIWECDEDAVFDTAWDAIEEAVGPVDAVIAGHSGLPFLRVTPRGSWINAGVVGMPPHDGAPQTRFAVLGNTGMRIERLEYDVDGAVSDMRNAGLPSDYADALRSGYWPSEDVLPATLRVPASARG